MKLPASVCCGQSSHSRIDPEAADYGELLIGASVQRDFVVENVGGLALAGFARLAGPDLGDFAFAGGDGPFALEPAETLTVSVRLQPSEAGPGL